MTRIAQPFAVLGASGLFLLSIFLVGCSDGRPSRVRDVSTENFFPRQKLDSSLRNAHSNGF